MPPKKGFVVRTAQPKASRKPAPQHYVATASGSRNEVRLQSITTQPSRSRPDTYGETNDYLTFQQEMLRAYDDDPFGSTNLPTNESLPQDFEIDSDRLPEDLADFPDVAKSNSGMVGEPLPFTLLY